MNAFDQYEVWFVTGAQLLYGGDAVIAVDAHSNEMVAGLNASGKLPVKVVYKGTVNSSKEVTEAFKAANNDEKCIGVITWMHTFSPAKMWIHGLQELKKPLLHFHTQFNKEIPWDTMDMDFMNLNQSAHGDREFGHIVTRMRKNRKVVVGHWQDEKAQGQIATWMRVCAGWADAQDMLIIRFGDQMNNVAVTDGDKVSAEQVLGYHVDYCPVSELMEYHKEIEDTDVDALVATYFKEYDHDAALEDPSTEAYRKVWNAAKAELAIRAILKAKGAKGFTTNFDDLGDIEYNGFDQIPGLASQRLIRCGRRLEIGRPISHCMGNESGTSERLFFPRRLYTQLRRRKKLYPAIAHVGSLSAHRCQQAPFGGTLPRHRYSQESDRQTGIHLKSRYRLHGYYRRYGEPFPPDRKRCRVHRTETVA